MGKQNISNETKKIILKLQQNEVTEQAIYYNLSKRVKKDSEKKILKRIGDEEGAHSEIWFKYTNKKLRPQKIKVYFYLLLNIILGYTFVIKIMEKAKKMHKVCIRN